MLHHAKQLLLHGKERHQRDHHRAERLRFDAAERRGLLGRAAAATMAGGFPLAPCGLGEWHYTGSGAGDMSLLFKRWDFLLARNYYIIIISLTDISHQTIRKWGQTV